MLAEVPRHRVLSEPPPLNQFLRETSPAASAQDVEDLRSLVSALGHPGRRERRFFVKFTSWNVLRLPLIRRAFPDVPFLFLYRDPVEVMVSNLTDGRAPWLWEEQITGIGVASAAGMSWAELCARVLAAKCDAAARGIAAAGQRGLAVPYTALTPSFIPTLVGFFGLEVSAGARRHMRRVMDFYSKTPAGSAPRRFKPDGRAKQAYAPRSVRSMARRWVAEPIRRLERVQAAAIRASCPFRSAET
jgi:hypothetical protein